MAEEGSIVVYFDGLCEPVNPGGVATYGFVVFSNGKTLKEGRAFVAKGDGATNSVAEYAGLSASLEWLLSKGYQNMEVLVKGDSRQVIYQMRGSWRARKGHYLPHYRRARELEHRFSKITFSWIPREENAVADKLSRRAYEDYCVRTGAEIKYSMG